MSEVSIEPINTTVINSGLNVGVLDAPDSHPKVILYDDKKATREIRQINNDVYEAQKHPNPTKNRKTPKSLIFIFGTVLLTGIVLFFKYFVKK